MRTTIDKTRFLQIKKIARSSGNNQTAANRTGVSLETIRKVKKAKSFAEYQANNKKSHRQVHPPVRVAVSTPQRRTPSNTTPTAEPKKKGFLSRFFGA